MNLYVRYFNDEALVGSLDEALEFLESVAGVKLDDAQTQEVADYVRESVSRPRRFKAHQHTYFIMIKTTTKSLEAFKANAAAKGEPATGETEKGAPDNTFSAENPGWYRAQISFKRVIPADGNAGKFQYSDTEFEARLKAHSVQECYDRVVNHLRTRDDVDARSQFPSIKGRNFHAEFLGMP